MKKRFNYLISFIITLIVGIFFGIIIHKYELFPYGYIKEAYYHFTQETYGPWAIGIYEGPTPFNLTDTKEISNPVLAGKDVNDIDARFVADPFMIIKDGKYFMFFEVLNRKTNQGDIGYAESEDGIKWIYRKIIIDEKFHLSYPYIFKWNHNYYLIPESNQDLSVRLYKALSFPDKWECLGNLLSGYRYVDPSIFRYKGKWWLFVSSPESDILNLYYSNNLLKGWKPHPMNPIIKFNKHVARPGGRVINYNGKLYRLTQDDDPSYGIRVFAFEINELSEISYVEKLVSEKPIINMTGKGWNAAGMHNIDMIKVKDNWIAVVDGRSE